MKSQLQISTTISPDTKARLDRYVRSSGVARSHLIEQALQHHLRALEELPLDVLVSARVVLAPESAKRVRDLTSHPPEPTDAMKQLFDDR